MKILFAVLLFFAIWCLQIVCFMNLKNTLMKV